VLKNRANVVTQLDANVDKLSTQLRANRGLIAAQFVPLYFSSVEELRTTIDRFIAVNGSMNGAKSREEAAGFAVLANAFHDASDRAFLSLFASSLWDEQTKFYHSYWAQEQRARANVIDSAQSLWQNSVRPRLQRTLNSTQQQNGDIILSLPLGGEGRTISASGNMRATVAITFPSRPSDVSEMIYVLVHELAGSIAAAAVSDNTTPAEQRDGTAERLVTIAAVRAGLMVFENAAPELADGYAQFYLREAGRPSASNPRAELAKLFSLPDRIRDGLKSQIESLHEGI
jgi:hypothetical protein